MIKTIKGIITIIIGILLLYISAYNVTFDKVGLSGFLSSFLFFFFGVTIVGIGIGILVYNFNKNEN